MSVVNCARSILWQVAGRHKWECLSSTDTAWAVDRDQYYPLGKQPPCPALEIQGVLVSSRKDARLLPLARAFASIYSLPIRSQSRARTRWVL